MRTSRDIDAVLIHIAAGQHGVFTTAQACDAGLTRQRVQARTDGRWATSLFRGVHVLGPADGTISNEAIAVAATLAGGSHAGAAFEFAAARMGYWDRGPDVVEVVADRRPRPLRDLPLRFCHTTQKLREDSFHVVGGLPTTTPALTLCELGARLTPWQLARVIGEAAFLGDFDRGAVGAILDQRRGWPFTRVVRRALELHASGSAGSRSRTEDRYIAAVATPGFADEPVVNVKGCTGFAWLEPDFVWPRHRLIVEIDGRQHALEPVAAEDERRDRMHLDAGWVTLRFPSWMVWLELPAVVRRTQAALRDAAIGVGVGA